VVNPVKDTKNVSPVKFSCMTFLSMKVSHNVLQSAGSMSGIYIHILKVTVVCKQAVWKSSNTVPPVLAHW